MMRYTTALIVETKREVQRTFVRVALAGSRLRTGGNVDPGGDPLKLVPTSDLPSLSLSAQLPCSFNAARPAFTFPSRAKQL